MAEPYTYQGQPLTQQDRHNEAHVVAFTDVHIPGRRISVTARDGATTEEILDTVRPLIEAAQTIETAFKKAKEAQE